MDDKYRIIKKNYESGDIRYQIQQKILFWWVDVGSEYWNSLQFTKDRLRTIQGNKVISEEII